MSYARIYTNPLASAYTVPVRSDLSLPKTLHQQLPEFKETSLVPLSSLAQSQNIRAIFIKDESSRAGLPAYKILGASWATFRAVCKLANLPLTASLQDVAQAAQDRTIVLFAATAGNHGRAVARMAKLLGVPSQIFVDKFAGAEMRATIESEGAHVTVVDGNYDDAVHQAAAACHSTPAGLQIQDYAFDGYSEIPPWHVEGYATLLLEVEEQLRGHGLKATHIVAPIGAGTLGHAVVQHAKSNGRAIKVLAVEPETGACLYHSLLSQRNETIVVGSSIMNGMVGANVSPISWPTLQQGIDASVMVTDRACHAALGFLHANSIDVGPCGAGTFAGYRMVAEKDPEAFQLTPHSVVVVLSTEGSRTYQIPE